MEIIIQVEFEKIDHELKFEKSPQIKDILRIINLNSEEVLVSKNKEFISVEDHAENGDKLKIIRVIVGGWFYVILFYMWKE